MGLLFLNMRDWLTFLEPTRHKILGNELYFQP